MEYFPNKLDELLNPDVWISAARGEFNHGLTPKSLTQPVAEL